jgi:hypothetical protein
MLKHASTQAVKMEGILTSHMDRKEKYGMEQSEETDASKGQGKRRNREQQTQAKPPPGAVGDRDPAPPPGGEGGCWIMVTASGERGRGQLKIQLMIQRIPDTRGGTCTVLWDSGAQISLVTHQYAKEARFGRRHASIQISGVGAGSKNESNVQYKALLKSRDGSIAEFTPYGVDKITGDSASMNLDKAKALFPFAACKLESPAGPVHMLIKMDHMEDAPQEEDRAQGVVLYCSKFCTRYTASGDMGRQIREGPPVKILNCRWGLFNPTDFIPAEAMGTEVPCRCPACRNCKECQFRMDSMTFKENAEYEVILSKLRLDVERKKWIAEYPFNTMVERLIDN